MQIQVSIGPSAVLSSIRIEHRQGQWITSIDPSSDPLALPYVVDYPTWNHRHWLYTALIRAVQVCSDADDFYHERLRLEMAYLSHGYSLAAWEQTMNEFQTHFRWTPSRYPIDPLTYTKSREQFLQWLEVEQKERMKMEERMAQNRLLHLHYHFDHGPIRRFHKQFYQIWSKYLNYDAHLSPQKSTILLTPKQIYSLNTLLVRSKPIDDFLSNRPKKN